MGRHRFVLVALIAVATLVGLVAKAGAAQSTFVSRFVGPGEFFVLEDPYGCPGFGIGGEGTHYNRTMVDRYDEDGNIVGFSVSGPTYGYFMNLATGAKVFNREQGNGAFTFHDDRSFSGRISGTSNFFLAAGDIVTFNGRRLDTPGVYQATGRWTLEPDVWTIQGHSLVDYCALLS